MGASGIAAVVLPSEVRKQPVVEADPFVPDDTEQLRVLRLEKVQGPESKVQVRENRGPFNPQPGLHHPRFHYLRWRTNTLPRHFQ